MRIPHTINGNFFKEFEPSGVALELIPDSGRIVKSENRFWDESNPLKLTEIALMEIVKNFPGGREILKELPCWDRNLLLESLPTDLPLSLAVRLIEDGIYWKRRVRERWKDEANYSQEYGFNWKRMFLEKHVQEAVEAMTPEGYDLEGIQVLCDLARDHVKRLNLRELQVKKLNARSEEDEAGEEIGFASQASDHIDLGPIVTGLINLTELHVQFGLRNLGSDYMEYYFQFSLDDCRNLGKGVAQSKNLKILRIHSCNLDDDRLISLLSSMEENESLESIDFSNCLLADDGASAVAKFMKYRPNLTRINLGNNKIGELGVSAISFMITQSYASPIEDLNLRFNPFGDGGFKFLASALVREKPVVRSLNVSCCNLTGESGIFLGEVLNRNGILTEVDFSNNWMGDEGGRALIEAVENSKTIQFLDVRRTGIPEEGISAVENVLHFNRIRAAKGEKGVLREIRLIERRAEEERLRLERLAAEEIRAAEEAARLEAEALARAAAEKDNDDD